MRLDHVRRNTVNLQLIVAIFATIGQRGAASTTPLGSGFLRASRARLLGDVETYKYRSVSFPPFHDIFLFDK
jgi:hypothetical protein